MNPKIVSALLWTFLVVPTLNAQKGFSFDILHADEYGYLPEVRWHQNRIVYLVNQDLSMLSLDFQEVSQALIAAANAWNQIEPNEIELVYGGPTTSRMNGLDGQNTVMWSTQANEVGAGGRARAVITADASTGVITDVDMVFNSRPMYDPILQEDRSYIWTLHSFQLQWIYDIQSIATHEFGHWLGIGHSPEYPTGTVLCRCCATMYRGALADMYCPVESPSLSLRTLENADIEAADYDLAP